MLSKLPNRNQLVALRKQWLSSWFIMSMMTVTLSILLTIVYFIAKEVNNHFGGFASFLVAIILVLGIATAIQTLVQNQGYIQDR